MAKKKPEDFLLACYTYNSSDHEYKDYGMALLYLTKTLARKLLRLQQTWKKLHQAQADLYGFELHDYHVHYHSIGALPTTDDLHEDGWTQLIQVSGLPWSVPIQPFGPSSSADCHMLCVTRNGVHWHASPRNDWGEFETQQLSWSVLKQVLAGQQPFPALSLIVE